MTEGMPEFLNYPSHRLTLAERSSRIFLPAFHPLGVKKNAHVTQRLRPEQGTHSGMTCEAHLENHWGHWDTLRNMKRNLILGFVELN